MGILRSRVQRRDERGAVAIMVAISMVMLVVTAALVTDFGVVRLDRQQNKLAADDAVMAGLRAAGNEDDGQMYNSLGICAALDFLKANRSALSGLPPCASQPTHVCTAGDTSVNYHGTTTSGANSYEVWIESPYLVNSASAGGAFPEEALGSLSTDAGDPSKGGCDQIAVVIRESTTPALGRIVTNGQPLVTRLRSVGRVKISNGDTPPALLLLERTNCSVLTVGSGGSPSRIAVKGSGETPATIHSDSTATGAGCGSGSNQQLFQGKQANGVVAYGGTTGRSGIISAVAADDGRPANVISDSISNVFATTGVHPYITDSIPVSPRKQVSRRPVDRRYLAGVTSAVAAARSQWVNNHSSPTGYTATAGCPGGGPAAMAAYMSALELLAPTDKLYIDCPQNSGLTLNGTISAGTVYFHGFIQGGRLALPNAKQVYIDNTNDSGARITSTSPALTVSNGSSFCIGASFTNCNPSSPSTGQCLDGVVPGAKAQLVIRRGDMNSSGGSSPGLLRLCNTTVIMQGSDIGSATPADPGGCLPTTWGIAPTPTPCPGSLPGTSPVSLSGLTDWTAPNSIGDMATLTPAAKQTLWDGGEDLTLWTETYGDGPTYKMAGGGNMHVAGVFFVPNAYPFTITGSGAQDLTNAQYITRTFAVDGGASLTMGVDPYNAVAPPTLDPFSLVR